MGRYAICDNHLTVDGKPTIPVMGEAHFSRIPAELWPVVLGQLRSLGVTIVSSYVFWNHHQPTGDATPCFAGQLDLAAFVAQARTCGLDFGLRIGPWVHGESRYGGLPDWVAEGPWRTRTNDPDYLAIVANWFDALAHHLKGAELAVLQVENELYDQPAHLAWLKECAAKAGIRADLTTATAWGGAQFDRCEFLPVYGGYPDTFWSPHSLGWEPRCAIHYRFQPIRDDALIGEDGRTSTAVAVVDDSALPYATCELGAGMTTAYHRRPHVQAADVGALGIAKIGCGSTWQGWYMMAGGLNPLAQGQQLNESLDTGSPNELPLRDYDFCAPIGAAGQLRESAHLLRMQHAMLATLGAELADSRIRFGSQTPLRHAVRSWPSTLGESALVAFNQHQPHTHLGTVDAFQLHLADGTAVPSTPVTISDGEFGIWAANLELGSGVVLRSSDLMPLARLDRAHPTWVLAQTLTNSASAELDLGGERRIIKFHPAFPPTPTRLTGPHGQVDLIVFAKTDLAKVWPVAKRCLLSQAPLLEADGKLVAVCDPETSATPVHEFTPNGLRLLGQCPELSEILLSLTTEPRSLPPHTDQWQDAHRTRITLPADAAPLDRLRIRWRGNVLRVVPADASANDIGAVLADQFWHGDGELTISIAHLAGARQVDVYIIGFEPGLTLVTGQPADCQVASASLLPVRVMPLTPTSDSPAPDTDESTDEFVDHERMHAL